jgi:hypothetical protein
VKDCVAPPVATLAVVGETTTRIAGDAVIVMVAAVDLVGSATGVAVSATLPEGAEDGAVYAIAAPDALDGLDRRDRWPNGAPRDLELDLFHSLSR